MWVLGKKLEKCTFLEFKTHLKFFNGEERVKRASYIRSNIVYTYTYVHVYANIKSEFFLYKILIAVKCEVDSFAIRHR
jgi:hypothetical protein